MSAGELRERLIFERRSQTDDGAGNKESAFVPMFECAARLSPRFSSRFDGEVIMAARLQGRQPVTVRVRFSVQTSQVTESWRARHKYTGAIYNIRAIANADEKRKYIDMIAETGIAT